VRVQRAHCGPHAVPQPSSVVIVLDLGPVIE
jgi:hypothetical protein